MWRYFLPLMRSKEEVEPDLNELSSESYGPPLGVIFYTGQWNCSSQNIQVVCLLLMEAAVTGSCGTHRAMAAASACIYRACDI